MDQLPLAPAGPLTSTHPQVHLCEKGGASQRQILVVGAGIYGP